MLKLFSRLRGVQKLALGFLMVILVGSFLLWLPVSAAPGEHTSYIDALFTATTSICVTGLVTVPTFAHWSLFGKTVILILIQLGGLGVVACATLLFLIAKKRISLKSRTLIKETYNVEHLSGMVRMIRAIVLGTFVVELLGAISYSFQFIPQFGLVEGIAQSIFTSISAFCNAGIDTLGPNSLANYVGNPLINLTTMLLIMAGGIGFIVWWDVKKVFLGVKRKEFPLAQFWRRLELHSKLAITVTLLLIVGGALAYMVLEWNNPESMGNLSAGQKVLASFFQSVTTRTAGFESIGQAKFTDASTNVSNILMFIGGSPMGTAGGMKTTTVALLIMTAVSFYKGKKHTEIFHRRLNENNVKTALVVVMTGLSIVIIMSTLLMAVTGFSMEDVIFEITSAIATVGLTRGITSSLNLAGKIIVIITMYIGRIGPITLVMALAKRTKASDTQIQPAERKVIIG
ncbi:MAG: potassium transporter TrkG [Lachnospiraceae bacterium]|nr:potassium transporter TrkG [Lachnospiraceae bacterium]